MQEAIRNGWAVKVTDAKTENTQTWNLTYHAIRNPNKPDKVRVVYNAAARFKRVATNDFLLKGPDLTTQLLAVLMRFRERRIGVSAGIARMFYQVQVRPSDRRFFRFLWRLPGSTSPPEECEMTVHVSGCCLVANGL